MEIKHIIPPSIGFLDIKLESETIEYLWKIIEKSKLDQEDYKFRLAGNISKSMGLHDERNYFYTRACIPLVKEFRKLNAGADPSSSHKVRLSPNTPLLLTEFWVNYQYKNEFNPPHSHGGVYSFVIWMKIPYNWNEQSKLSQLQGITERNIKAGCFEFEYIDALGEIRNFVYRLSSEFEGRMLFFPAGLRHSVYPFYEIDEPRISISGNLWY